MYEHLHCIALRTVKYSDRHSILTAYTLERGRISLLTPGGTSKVATRCRALTMPMSAFECIADIRTNRDIYPFKDLRADETIVISVDYANPARNVVAIFLADFFNHTLLEPVADGKMFDLLHRATMSLNSVTSDAFANLHLAVMVEALEVLGIMPDVTTAIPGAFFSISEGVWIHDISAFNDSCLDLRESAAAKQLLRMTLRNRHKFRFSREDRNRMLDRMLEYFRVHGFPNLELPSLNILREIF